MAMFLLFDEAPIEAARTLPLDRLWYFLPIGYLATILVETPVLLVGLSPKVSLRQKLFCGAWLTACTYPVVVLVLPALMFEQSRWHYLAVAEVFAPVAECLIFWATFRGKLELTGGDWFRCLAAIVCANLASFGVGEVLNHYGWFGLF